jgi:hypothetical protein
MIDVGNDGEISDVIHGGVYRGGQRAGVAGAASTAGHEAGDTAIKSLQQQPASLRDGATRCGVSRSKKRHVELLTRLPTKRLATACWAFIVAKRPKPETAPLLDFLPLRVANNDFHPQVIHKCLWVNWG